MVHLQKVYEGFKQKGVVVLGFNTADTREKVEALMRAKGATYPTILDGSARVQQIATNRYRSSTVPMNYIIDPKGRIAAAFSGYREGDERGDDAIRAILAGRGPAEHAAAKAVHGRILALGGRPLSGARLSLIQDGGRASYSGTTDDDGDYAIRDVPRGTYRILVHVIGRGGFSAPGGRVTVDKAGAARHDVRLPDTTIEGRIVDGKTGKPFDYRDVRVTATPLYFSAIPDDEGRYRLVGLPPGTYRLAVTSSRPDLVRQVREVELENNAKGIDFALARVATGVLRLKVIDARGQPARGIEFWLAINGGVRSLYGKYVDSGVYEFELKTGAREVVIRGQEDPVRVTIRDGKTTDSTFRLR